MSAVPDAGEAFVGCLLWSTPEHALYAAELIRADNLADPQLGSVLGLVTQLACDGITPAADAVLAAARGRAVVTGEHAIRTMAERLHQLAAQAPVAASAGWYAQRVLDDTVRRRATEAATRIAQAAARVAVDDLHDIVTAEAGAVREVDRRRRALAQPQAKAVRGAA